MPRDHVRDGRRRAAIRHVHHVDARQHLEQLARHVDRRAVAGGGHVELAGIGLGVGDEFRNGRDRQVLVDHDHVREADDAGDGRDVAQEIEVELRKQRRVDGIGRRDQQQRVAVRRRVDDGFRREIGGSAGPALDHHGLTELLLQPLGGEARRDVGRSAGRVADDEPDGACRICLCTGTAHERREGERCGGGRERGAACGLHEGSLSGLALGLFGRTVGGRTIARARRSATG